MALSHDWLTGMRGGEKCLELLCAGFPAATIHTLIHKPERISETINRHRIITSWLQAVPGITSHYRYFLPFFTTAVAMLPRPEADLLISTSHCVAKGVRMRRGTRHLCYCFTPMRYAWTFHDEYFGDDPVKRRLVAPLLAYLRDWDRRSAARVDRFVAISQHIRRRIDIFYGRQADVVYPPADTEFYTPDPRGGHDGYDLVVSALVPYKRIDLAVAAYSQFGYPLKVVGTGGEYERLRAVAAPNVEFLGWQPNEAIRDLYRRCRLLVFPGEEDFGIVPVEAQACGKPVVAYGRGGATETIVEEKTGVFFQHQSEEALLGAVHQCADRAWSVDEIRRNAERFSVQNFIDGMDESIRRCLSA